MKKELANLSEMTLAGISVRTNNQNESDPGTSKIMELVTRYTNHNIADQISDRKNPGVTFIVYTHYESDEHGDYTCFMGQEITSPENISPALETLKLAATQYQKFTTPSGKMPMVVVGAWQQIWKMTPAELDGQRAYQADFEIYDHRAADPNNTVVDIYVGIK